MNLSTLVKRKMLLYRSLHRGCKETDIILGNFALHNIYSLTPQDLDLYEEIVNTDDLEIYSYITKNSPIPAKIDADLMNRILLFNEKYAYIKQ